MKFIEIPEDTKDDQFVFIECDITGKTKKTRYGAAKANVARNNGQYITNWGLAKLNNPMKNKEVRDKVKKTNLEKYGSTMPMNSAENIAERKKMFKDEEFIKRRVESSKKTCLDRYGVEHHMKSEQVKENQKAAMREKYGVDHPYQSPEILAKMQENNLKKYGVKNVASLPEVQLKMAATNLEKYGVEYYNQLPEMRDYLRENCKEWLKESWADPWAKGITRPEEWNQKQRETVTQLIIDGKWKSGHKNSWRGFYKSIGKCKRENSFFRSGFELIYHFYLDHCESVEWYDYEPFSITYEFNAKIHRYIPDFFVKMIDSDILYIREVKADYLHDSEETQAKYLAAIEFVKTQKNMDYSVVLKKDIYELGIDFEEIKEHPNVIITHNPRN